MSTFALKLIAIITMLIDHVGAVFVPSDTVLYLVMRSIGRLAFPIFIFLLVEGFYHTRDIKKYLIRMGIFTFVSEIPFDLAFYSDRFHSNPFTDLQSIFENSSVDSELLKTFIERLNSYQNVFFTLFLGLLLITIIKMVENKFKKQILVIVVLDVLLIISFCIIAKYVKNDYGFAGILLIVAFYLFRESKILLTSSVLIIISVFFCNFDMFRQTGNILAIVELFALLSMILIAFYNGKKGKNIKYVFYIFYPAHLLVIALIKTFF